MISSVLASLFSSRMQYACLRSLSPEDETWQLIRSLSDIQTGKIKKLFRKGRIGAREVSYFCFIDYAKAFDNVDHLTTWPPDLPLEKSVWGQEATVRTGRGRTDWFQIGKGVHQGCILSPYLFNLYAEYLIGWMKHKLESRLPGEVSVTSDMQMTQPLWHKVKKN